MCATLVAFVGTVKCADAGKPESDGVACGWSASAEPGPYKTVRYTLQRACVVCGCSV